MQVHNAEFFVNWDGGAAGKITKGVQKRQCDFALKLTTMVEAGELTGYFCEVRRELDGEIRYPLPTVHVVLQPLSMCQHCTSSGIISL